MGPLIDARTARAHGCRANRRTASPTRAGSRGETLNAIQTVQAFTLEDAAHASASARPSRIRSVVAVRRTRVRALLTALATMLVFGAITFVLWIGAHAVAARRDDAAGS